jgi:hypothetical protein
LRAGVANVDFYRVAMDLASSKFYELSYDLVHGGTASNCSCAASASKHEEVLVSLLYLAMQNIGFLSCVKVF